MGMKRPLKLAALAASLAASFAAMAGPAQAGVTSASITDATTVTLDLNGANDIVTVSVAKGLLVHDQTTGGLNSATDWDSVKDGDQSVPADGTFTVVINGGDGNDALAVLAKNTEIAFAVLNGQAGDDALTGADSGDVLSGGEGDDRLVGAPGDDLMGGGPGNDTFVWNNGDGSDRLNGDAGNDGLEVNGSPTLGDAFSLEAVPGGVRFKRLNLKSFTLDTATERIQVNGLGGNEFVEAGDGVGALTQLSVDGGAGADLVFGSDGPDLIRGGEGNDVLNGGGSDDRIVGDRGSDTMNGDAGDDTLVWNNGDGTDVVNGDDGRDDVEVNGAPTGDAFTVQPSGARTRFDRTNLVPFSLDIGTTETLHANGLGGDDAISVGDVGAFAVTAAGGPGSDTLIGGASSDTFVGGSGNDTIAPGGGLDVVFGDDGDDQVDVRDNTADVARGGDGNDSVVADGATLDILDSFEFVDRTADVTPPPAVTPPPVDRAPLPVTIRGGVAKVRDGAASIRLSCPANSPANCTGSLVVRTTKGAKVGSARYDLRPGVTKALKVRLTKRSQQLARHHGGLKVVAVASAAGSGTTPPSSQRLTLSR
jgi:Ca2+-binding RTX toxin-like protein